MVEETAKKRACFLLDQLKTRRKEKHTSSCRQKIPSPTILNGATLRIAFTFNNRTNGSDFLLVTNFSRKSPARACSSYQLLKEKLLVYVLPIEEFQSSLAQSKVIQVSHPHRNGDNPSVSDYFSKSSHAPQPNCDKKHSLQKIIKKKTKKNKEENSVPADAMSSTAKPTNDKDKSRKSDVFIGLERCTNVQKITTSWSIVDSDHGHSKAERDTVYSGGESNDGRFTYARNSSDDKPIRYPGDTSDKSKDFKADLLTTRLHKETNGSDKQTTQPKSDNSKEILSVKPIVDRCIPNDSQSRFRFRKTTTSQVSKHPSSTLSVVRRKASATKVISSETKRQHKEDSPDRHSIASATGPSNNESDSLLSKNQQYGLDISPEKISNPSSSVSQKYGLDISPTKDNANLPESTNVESKIQKPTKRQFGLDISSEDEDFILEPIKRKRKKTTKDSSVVRVRRCLKKKQEVSSETSDSVVEKRRRGRPPLNKGQRSNKGDIKFKAIAPPTSYDKSKGNSFKISEIRHNKENFVSNSDTSDESAIPLPHSRKPLCAEKPLSIELSDNGITSCDSKQKQIQATFSTMSSGLDENTKRNGCKIKPEKLKAYLSGKLNGSNETASTSHDSLPERFNAQAVINDSTNSAKREAPTSPINKEATPPTSKESITLKTRRRFMKSALSSLSKSGKDADAENQEEPEDIFKDCIVLEELNWTPSKENSAMEASIRRLDKVCDLSLEQLEYLVLKNEYYLRQIFQGKVYNRRHEDYKKGGKARVDLMYQINVGLYKEDQHDTVMETLMKMFCKRHTKYFDYVMRVMLPEILIKIYMHVHGLTHAQTEQAMCEALNTPGAIFI